MAKELAIAELVTVGQARKLLQTAGRFVDNGKDALKNGPDKNDDFVAAAVSALTSAARWVREAQGLLAGEDSAKLTQHQKEKAFHSYKQALTTMQMVDRLANDKTSWVEELKTAARQTVGAVSEAAGAVVSNAANLAGSAAGGILGGIFKNLGVGAIGLGVVVGVALYIRRKAA